MDDFYLVHQKQVQPFKGDLDDYYQWLQTKEGVKESTVPAAANAYREKKSLQNRLKKLEQMMDGYQQKTAQVETMLAEPKLYEDVEKNKLNQLLLQRDSLQQELSLAEEEWLQVASALEQVDCWFLLFFNFLQ